MKKYVFKFFMFLFIFSLTRFEYVQGWASGGHMTVAEIAYEQLHPKAKAQADELISILVPFYPENDTFVKAATWLDLINHHDFRLLSKWHYTNKPFDPEGILTNNDHKLIQGTNADADILYGIEHAIKTLKSPKANPFEKAFMLRYLIHAVADAHQPLHTTSLYNFRFPNGDQGGNLFLIDSPLAKKLHQLWDLGLGAIPEVELQEVISEESLDEVHNFAHSLMAIHSKESFSDVVNSPKEQWIQESHTLAKSEAYTLEPGAIPSEEYLEKGRVVCKKQIALAGYRLGVLLNEIFDES